MRKRFLALGLAVFTPLALTAACGGSDTPMDSSSGTGGKPSTDGMTGGLGGENLGGASASTGGASGGQPSSTGGDSSDGGMTGNWGGLGGMGGVPFVVEVPDFEGEEPCVSDKACTGKGLLCDLELRICVGCFSDDDCGDQAVCEAGQCSAISTCGNSLDCTTDEVCVKQGDQTEGICQECGMDADCTEGGICVEGSCKTPCESDKACTPDGLLCNGELGACMECLESSDCQGAETCMDGECKASVCEPSLSQCLHNAVVTCRQDGRGYQEPVDCGDATCGLDGETVSCITSEGPAGNGPNLVWEDFSDGPADWRISGTDNGGAPSIEGGAACVELSNFTLGWPGKGMGFDLSPGSYTFSFRTKTEAWAGVEAKVAAADEPWQPVYFATQDFDVSKDNRHSFDFDVSEGGENVGLAFNVWNNEGKLCFDEISLSRN